MIVRFIVRGHKSKGRVTSAVFYPVPNLKKGRKVDFVMQIFLEPELVNGKLREWGLIEFQGEFVRSNSKEKIFPNEYIGELSYTEEGVPFFTNGQHVLYGEEVKLERPFAVMEKNFKEGDCIKEYIVKAVIRKKVLFKNRPQPVTPKELIT